LSVVANRSIERANSPGASAEGFTAATETTGGGCLTVGTSPATQARPADAATIATAPTTGSAFPLSDIADPRRSADHNGDCRAALRRTPGAIPCTVRRIVHFV
jgi:hypothetical protein